MVTRKIAIAFAPGRIEQREGGEWQEQRMTRGIDRRNKLYILPCQTKTKAAAANRRPVVITTLVSRREHLRLCIQVNYI